MSFAQIAFIFFSFLGIFTLLYETFRRFRDRPLNNVTHSPITAQRIVETRQRQQSDLADRAAETNFLRNERRFQAQIARSLDIINTNSDSHRLRERGVLSGQQQLQNQQQQQASQNEINRIIREEQDLAYVSSLAYDQQKEEKKKERKRNNQRKDARGGKEQNCSPREEGTKAHDKKSQITECAL